MLITKTVEVGIGGVNYNYYKNLGYKMNGYTPIIIPIEHLSLGSHTVVDVQCDYCGILFPKAYKSLISERKKTYIKKDSCENCCHIKTQERSMELYGVSNNFQRPEILEKIKNTNIERYGTEFVSQVQSVKDKVKNTVSLFSEEKIQDIKERTIKTVTEKYGVPYYVQTEEYLVKKKETCLEKYGVDDFSRAEEVRKKYRETCLEKYGSENYFGSDLFKDYIKEYWMELNGVDHYSKTEDFREKIKFFWDNISDEQLQHKYDTTKQTCLDRYGFEFALQLPKTRKTLYNKMGYPTSKKQIVLFETIQKRFPDVLENIEMFPYLVDMMISTNSVNLVIEYDCWYWHLVETDERKNKFLASKNFKLLRIKSGKLIPDEEILFDKICELLDTDLMYSEIILKDWNEERYREGRIRQ